MTRGARALRLARSVRYLHPWQVVGRVWAAARPRLGLPRLPAPPDGLRGAFRPAVPIPAHEPWNTRADVLAGHFTFLNAPADLGTPVDWRAQGQPLLWRFNLHYFHFLHLLAPDEQAALCRAWVQANPPGTPVAWHPYPTSLRILNWCRSGVAAPDLQASLYRQAASLYRTLETYVRGNHLVENARALVYAGRFFEGQGEAPRWLARGLGLFRRLTPEVVLPDGGFFERSPMYHALMLEAYLDVVNLLPPDHPDRPLLADTARRMNDALATLTHPDGTVALFNDSTQEIAPAPAVVHDYAARLLGHTPTKRPALPESGFFSHESDRVYLIVDGGKLAPDYLPGHGHADLFSFELSLGGRKFVVDSGVFEYQEGEMRQYGRSTRAHSTVQVDGVDQAEVYGSFRAARRFDPRDVTFETTPDRSRFSGTFDGYAHLIGDGIEHRRTIEADDASETITVEDQVTGRGAHRVANRLHLHPDVEVAPHEDGYVLTRGDVRCVFRAEGAWRVEAGWYSPNFGVKRATPVLVATLDGPLPVRMTYTLGYGDAA